MQQPELEKTLIALRRQKNLTQEELVEKSHVSVRTIQRIEAGEVLPRMSTIKILLEALGETYESFSTKFTQVMNDEKQTSSSTDRTMLLVAAIAGAIYLVSEVILSAMDIAWMVDNRDWHLWENAMYTALSVLMAISFLFFARGFIVLSTIFENPLLKAITYVLMVAIAGKAALDISTLSVDNVETLWLPYAVVSVIFGALGIVFGVALIRLQDGMGELCRIAGILEILVGVMFITVVLFFLAYVVLIPTLVVEILILYRGYEYLSRSRQEDAVIA